MTMKRQFSLAHLTTLALAPPEMTYLAAKAGYDFVSFRLIPVGMAGEPQYLPQDRVMIRRTRAALAETGLQLLDLELARIVENVDPRSYLQAMEAAAELGARHVITSAWTASRDDRGYLIDSFSTLCELARPLGLTVDFEFPTFSRIASLREAADIVAAAGCKNGGILVDMLYMHFARVSVAELAALPPQWFHFAHFCDATIDIPTTIEGQIQIARGERLYPGEGAINLAAIVSTLPDVPLSIELPHTQRALELGYEEHARRSIAAARHYLDTHLPEISVRTAGQIVK
jgi:sugar phosphate isomerase/epimerase